LSKAFLYDATQQFVWLFSSSYIWTNGITTRKLSTETEYN